MYKNSCKLVSTTFSAAQHSRSIYSVCEPALVTSIRDSEDKFSMSCLLMNLQCDGIILVWNEFNFMFENDIY